MGGIEDVKRCRPGCSSRRPLHSFRTAIPVAGSQSMTPLCLASISSARSFAFGDLREQLRIVRFDCHDPSIGDSGHSTRGTAPLTPSRSDSESDQPKDDCAQLTDR